METAGSTNKRYFYGLDLVAGTSGTTATTNYFTHDAHGSVALTTNTSGAAVQPYEYDAFGNLLNAASGDTNLFRYSGEYFDSETGNYYLRARYYAPGIGRFTQQDTHWNVSNLIYGDDKQTTVKGMEGFATIPQLLAIKQAGNRYGYCANDPINYIDSSGELAITLTLAYAGVLLITAIILADPNFHEACNDAFEGLYREIKTGIDILTAEDASDDSNDEDLPQVKYPGDDPNESPGEDWEWRGPKDKGSWYNPKTGETWHPDLNHGGSYGPHWDYNYKGSGSNGWRVYSDGRIVPK